MADDYTPSDEDVYGVWTNYQCFYADDGYGPRGADRAAAEMDRFIAKVKRDAAREALASAEDRATQARARIRHLEATAQITVREALRAEAERDEWRQTALDERGATLDLLEQIKVRDRRIQAVQHLVDQADHAGNWTVTCSHLQRAIDGTNPYRASETA